MFRKLYNQATVSGHLEPDGPILIVQGGAALDPVAPDLAFVRTVRRGERTVYLPGSSLKGVLRAHVERILATEVGPPAAENPFDTQAPRRQRAHAERGKEKVDTRAVFRLSCEADRLFGSTEIAGRFRIGDAYPPAPEDDRPGFDAANRTEIRYGVAIHRAKQSVRFGPFEQEAVTAGRFAFRATLENFELWMLSLILQAFQDLDGGLVQLGHAKSRGFGSVRVVGPELVLRWPGADPGRLAGAGAREGDEDLCRAYGLDGRDAIDLPAGGEAAAKGLFSGYRYAGWDGINAVLDAVAADPWRRFVDRAKGEVSDGT